MHSRRQVVAGGALLGIALAGCLGAPAVNSGENTGGAGAGRRDDSGSVGGVSLSDGPLSITSPAFYSGDDIPVVHTCDGENSSPRLEVTGVPAAATTLALIVDDPDAPGSEPFVHWLLWDVPASRTALPPGLPTTPRLASLGGASQGSNSMGALGYLGPCPPREDGPHTYRFALHVVEGSLDVAPGGDRSTLESALAGRTLATATLTGTFGRGGTFGG